MFVDINELVQEEKWDRVSFYYPFDLNLLTPESLYKILCNNNGIGYNLHPSSFSKKYKDYEDFISMLSSEQLHELSKKLKNQHFFFNTLLLGDIKPIGFEDFIYNSSNEFLNLLQKHSLQNFHRLLDLDVSKFNFDIIPSERGLNEWFNFKGCFFDIPDDEKPQALKKILTFFKGNVDNNPLDIEMYVDNGLSTETMLPLLKIILETHGSSYNEDYIPGYLRTLIKTGECDKVLKLFLQYPNLRVLDICVSIDELFYEKHPDIFYEYKGEVNVRTIVNVSYYDVELAKDYLNRYTGDFTGKYAHIFLDINPELYPSLLKHKNFKPIKLSCFDIVKNLHDKIEYGILRFDDTYNITEHLSDEKIMDIIIDKKLVRPSNKSLAKIIMSGNKKHLEIILPLLSDEIINEMKYYIPSEYNLFL